MGTSNNFYDKRFRIRGRKKKVLNNRIDLASIEDTSMKSEVHGYIEALYIAAIDIRPEIADIEIENPSIDKIIELIMKELEKSDIFDISFIPKSVFNDQSVKFFKFMESDRNMIFYLILGDVYNYPKRLLDLTLSFLKKIPGLNFDDLDDLYIIEDEMKFSHGDDDGDLKIKEEIRLECKRDRRMQKRFRKISIHHYDDEKGNYKPRKKEYKALLNLLKENENTDFSLISKLSRNFYMNNTDSLFFEQLFGFFIDEGSLMQYSIDFINSILQEQEYIEPNDVYVINVDDHMIKEFTVEQKELDKVLNFIKNFNQL